MDTNDQAALRLLAELQRLTDPNQPTAARVTIRSAAGEYLGEAPIPVPAIGHAAMAVSAMADYANRPADPRMVADIEDHFADVDPESYLADVFGGHDAEASLIAYEQLVTGEWDGDVL